MFVFKISCCQSRKQINPPIRAALKPVLRIYDINTAFVLSNIKTKLTYSFAHGRGLANKVKDV